MRTPYAVKLEDLDPSVDASQEDVAANHSDKHERCPYCNTKLLFTHELDLSYFEVTEQSRCPGCGVHLEPQKFTLQ